MLPRPTSALSLGLLVTGFCQQIRIVSVLDPACAPCTGVPAHPHEWQRYATYRPDLAVCRPAVTRRDWKEIVRPRDWRFHRGRSPGSSPSQARRHRDRGWPGHILCPHASLAPAPTRPHTAGLGRARAILPRRSSPMSSRPGAAGAYSVPSRGACARAHSPPRGEAWAILPRRSSPTSSRPGAAGAYSVPSRVACARAHSPPRGEAWGGPHARVTLLHLPGAARTLVLAASVRPPLRRPQWHGLD